MNNTNFALLVLRVGVGLNMLILHGWGKLTAGPAMWHMVGGAMPSFGISFMPYVWGFLAMFAEFFASLLIVLGALFPLATFLAAFNMVVAVSAHLRMPESMPMHGWMGASPALAFLAAFVALFISGPGKYVLKFKK